MVYDIVSRLPIKSIIRFIFVCKNFHNLSRNPDLVWTHLSRAAKNNPCLIFHYDYPLSNRLYFVDPDHDERVRRLQTPFPNSMQEYNVVGSCEGILCLVNSLFDDILYVYNPFTRQYKELPRSIEFQDQEVIYGIGFHSITKDYKVIKIIYYANTYSFSVARYTRSEVQIISLSENKWRSLGKIPYQLDRKSTVALVNGRLHWMRKSFVYSGKNEGLIISFDISNDLFREVSTPDCVNRTTVGGCHLAVLSGCLSIFVPVQNRLGGFDIWMMKEYIANESWVNQFHFGPFYSPRLLDPFLRGSYEIWRSALKMRFVRVLCLLENGEILIEYKGRILVSYNPKSGRFKELKFPGMPQLFQTCIHFGSFKRFR